jgi:hypothetical protein
MEKRPFCQDRLGTNIVKVETVEPAFCAGGRACTRHPAAKRTGVLPVSPEALCEHRARWPGWRSGGDAGERTVFLSHVYIKLMILPRQARDKHRESCTQKEVFLSQRCLDSLTWEAILWQYVKHNVCDEYLLRGTYVCESGSARKSRKRFRDTPRFKNFQDVLARIPPF